MNAHSQILTVSRCFPGVKFIQSALSIIVNGVRIFMFHQLFIGHLFLMKQQIGCLSSIDPKTR